MAEYNWCHGPNCHERRTTTRGRGVKGSKVLRTRKVKYWSGSGFYNYFCSNSCYNEFANKHVEQIIAIAPRTEALETPINVTKETTDNPYWGRRVETKIEVDETRQM